MYEEFIEQQPYAMSKFDSNGNCVFYNSKELEYRNIDKKNLVHIYDNFNTKEILQLKNSLALMKKEKKEIFFEYKKDFKFYKIRMIQDSQNNIISTTRDISYEKSLEIEVKKEKENIKRLDDAITGANIGFWDFFPQEGKILANKTWVTQKKYICSDFRRDDSLFSEIIDGLERWSTLVHPDDLEHTIELIQKHLDGKTDIYEAEFRMKCGDGTWKWIYDLGQVFQRDEEGKAFRMNGVHIDITKIKNLQMELEKRSLEIKQANKKLTHSMKEVESLKEEYKLKSRLDLLTEIYNKDYFIEVAPSLLEISKEYKEACSLLFLDLDHFKKTNDNHGHLVGDEVLKETVNRINSCIREGDLLARFGGEEFVLLLPSTNEENALVFAERIRNTLNDKVISFYDAEVNVSISIGLSSTKNDNYDLVELLKNADNALYSAKRNGRNNTKVYLV